MEHNPKDIKYGLIVVDPEEKGDSHEILHFVGYWDKPTKEDVKHLREELLEDESFGLTETIDRLEILPAPDYIVEHFIGMIDE
jgi:hypothetical protein